MVTVVIAWDGSTAELADMVGAIAPTAARLDVQVVVALAGATEDVSFGAAEVVLRPEGAPLTELRAAGMAAATGDVVTLHDPARPPDVDTLERLVAAHRTTRDD